MSQREIEKLKKCLKVKGLITKGTRSLASPCQVRSVLTYDVLLRIARRKSYISPEQVKMLK